MEKLPVCHRPRYEPIGMVMRLIKGGKHGTANPDRYFVAFAVLAMPRSTAPLHLWPRTINETFLFEQPLQPSLDDVMDTAKQAWPIAQSIEITNFYEMNAIDYKALLGDESGWTVIHE